MRRALLVFGLGDAAWLPLLAELARATGAELHLLPGGLVAEARAAGLPVRDVLRELDAAAMSRIAAGRARFAGGLVACEPRLAAGFRVGRHALWPRLREPLVRALVETAEQALVVGAALEALARTTRLAAAVLGVDMVPAGRALAAATRRLGVPTVHVPHAVFGRPRVPMRWQGSEPFTDVVCAPGRFSRDLWLANGVAPDAVPVTGSPRWDGYARLDAPARAAQRTQVARALGLDPAAPILVYGPSWIERETANSCRHLPGLLTVYQGVLAAVRAHPRTQLVVKLHPGEFTRRGLDPAALYAGYAGVARRAGVDRLVVTPGWKTELLTAADLVVSINSNLGLEALLCGRPVVNVPPMAADADLLFTSGPGLVALGDPAETADAVAALLADPARRLALGAAAPETAARWVHAPDGRAGERVASVVAALAQAA